jgi:tetratricopeptide (TPR) repeat protein
LIDANKHPAQREIPPSGDSLLLGPELSPDPTPAARLASAKASLAQAEEARRQSASLILESTREMCQQLIAEAEAAWETAQRLEADARQGYLVAKEERELAEACRIEAEAYRERIKAGADLPVLRGPSERSGDGFATESVEESNQAAERNGAAAQARFEGDQLVVQERFAEAIARYDEAIRLNPELAETYNSRALAQQQLGQEEPAIQDYIEALRRDPEYFEAYCNLGVIYADQGQHTQAVENYTQAICFNPQDAMVYAFRAWSYTELGQYARAQEDLEQALNSGFDPTTLAQVLEESRQQR